MLDHKIYTFLALCKNMNYRVTAEQLNMTQPAVTNHIHQLENEYKCKLFIYQNRVLYKTEHAQFLEEYARSAEYNSQKISNKLASQQTDTLRIGATRTIGSFIVNSKIKSLINQNDINLDYIVDNTSNLLSQLRDGRLDFAFIEGYIDKTEFVFQPFRVEKVVGICSKDHPFANQVVDIDEIFANRLILREDGSGTREAFERVLSKFNYTINSFRRIIKSTSMALIREFVEDGLGISFAYESATKNSENLATFNLKNIDYSHEFTCIYLKDTEKSKYLSHFLDFVE